MLAVASDGDPAYALEDVLAPERSVRFDEPMSRAELADYVAARLAGAAVPEAAKRRFDTAALGSLYD